MGSVGSPPPPPVAYRLRHVAMNGATGATGSAIRDDSKSPLVPVGAGASGSVLESATFVTDAASAAAAATVGSANGVVGDGTVCFAKDADSLRRLGDECAVMERRIEQLLRREHLLGRRMHRVQTKSGVEVAYSELKKVVAQGQQIFDIPCTLTRNNSLVGQGAQKGYAKASCTSTTGPARLSEASRAHLLRTAGTYSALVGILEKLCDSSATESSSEEEDVPARHAMFDGKQRLTPFRYAARDASATPRHPAWRWAADRAVIGARWTWLQSAVSELEYRIRQLHELCRQLKTTKQPCVQPPAKSFLNHDRDQETGCMDSSCENTGGTCARALPLNENFRKRRLLLPSRLPGYAAEAVPMNALQVTCDCAALYPRFDLCVRCALLHAQARRERLELCDDRVTYHQHQHHAQHSQSSTRAANNSSNDSSRGASVTGACRSCATGSANMGATVPSASTAGSFSPYHIGLAGASVPDAQLSRQLLSCPGGERQSENSRLAARDETYHSVLSGRVDVSLAFHYEDLLRSGYKNDKVSCRSTSSSTGPFVNGVGRSGSVPTPASHSGNSSSDATSSYSGSRRKEMVGLAASIRSDTPTISPSYSAHLQHRDSRDSCGSPASKRKRHSSQTTRVGKNDRRSAVSLNSGPNARIGITNGVGDHSSIAKRRRPARSRSTSSAGAARASSSCNSAVASPSDDEKREVQYQAPHSQQQQQQQQQHLQQQQPLTPLSDADVAVSEERANHQVASSTSGSGRPRKTSYVSQQEKSYDIDNIVIPYGIMTCVRPAEPFKYKEILTPKWRIVDIELEHLPSVPISKSADVLPNDLGLVEADFSSMQSGSDIHCEQGASNKDAAECQQKDKVQPVSCEGQTFSDSSQTSKDNTTTINCEDSDLVIKEYEDMSDAIFQARHSRHEELERQRFSAYLKPKLSGKTQQQQQQQQHQPHLPSSCALGSSTAVSPAVDENNLTRLNDDDTSGCVGTDVPNDTEVTRSESADSESRATLQRTPDVESGIVIKTSEVTGVAMTSDTEAKGSSTFFGVGDGSTDGAHAVEPASS